MAERQAVRRRVLVAAGFELIGTVGWQATTVRGACKAANLNPRYFYESFADLDELLLAVYDDVVGQGIAVLATVAAEAPPELAPMVRAVVSAGFRFLAADPRRARVLFVEAAGHRALDRRRFDTLLGMADQVKAMGSRLQPADTDDGTGAAAGGAAAGGAPAGGAAEGSAVGVTAAEPRVVDARADRLGTVAANLLVGGVTELCVAWLEGRLDMTIDELADDVTALAVGTAEAAARLVDQLGTDGTIG